VEGSLMGTNQRSIVVMSDEEIRAFVASARTATLATVGPTGRPHLVAMWFGLLDERVCFETKTKSQKATNLRRDPGVSCMMETGDTYDALRGVAIEGTAVVISDRSDSDYWRAATSVFERYYGPSSDETRPSLEAMMHNRVIVVIEPERVRSWDHRKLGIPAMAVSGTTATSMEHLRRAP
jgi:PPOX class probable F420-dependent enzyme